MERDPRPLKCRPRLAGIRETPGRLPDLLFVIDVNKEDLGILEAKKLGSRVANRPTQQVHRRWLST